MGIYDPQRTERLVPPAAPNHCAVMGRFVNGPWLKFGGWGLPALISLADL